ncbi:DEAD/DEAH box RNA helicase, putative [Bodo saltans]|uniref:DEAD/DEAH box RNA helicase, putative n=1 Tax=Bodo saltans TaxID=75058 RepID=A0A0S4IUB4_BODSA|nr:DEAD/DEAH box RNA helicase, putative [Bodo saltans]|eukprot:CUF95125.1 DEAD/DEAH box RNA helicase, putative [Bodo saltans]
MATLREENAPHLGVFGVTDDDGLLCDVVSHDALSSLVPPTSTTTPPSLTSLSSNSEGVVYTLSLPARSGVINMDLFHHAQEVRVVPPTVADGDDANDDDSTMEGGGVSDEERLLILWGRVESFVATTTSTARAAATAGASPAAVVVVLSLPGPTSVMFVRRAAEDILVRYPALTLTIVIPKPSSSRHHDKSFSVLHAWHQAALARLQTGGDGIVGPRLLLTTSKTIAVTVVPLDRSVEQSPARSQHDNTPISSPLHAAALSDGLASNTCSSTPLMTKEFLDNVVGEVAKSPSRVALVAGPTGCGKSTKVPMAIVDASPTHTVWVAQPRRVAAVSLCRRIEEERGNSYDAAYIIGGARSDDSESSASAARIIFMTSGVMLQRVKSAFRDGTYLKETNVTHIILDEVHERTIEYDLLMCMLRELLRYHTTLRLVLTSATMSSKGLQLYMAQRHVQPEDESWPPTMPMAANHGAVSETPLSALRRRYNTGTEEHDASRMTLSTIVPVLSFHTSARRRRTVYIEEAFQTIVDAACQITQEVRGASSSGGSADPCSSVFDNPSPANNISHSADAHQRHGGRGAIAYLKIPFSLTSLIMRPAHKDSLLWEARFSMTAWLIRILHYTRPTEEAILVFMSGIQQLEALEAELLQNMGCTGLHILLLHSSNDAENKALFDAPPDGCRKVLIATNIAESSLTIPDVDHVIDTCVVKDQRYLHDEDLSMLEETYCSKDSCEQRAGRTGRVRPGSVWRMITREEYNALEEGRIPGIMQTPLTSTMLLVADANVGELDPFLAALPAPPPLRGVLAALTQLTEHYHALAPCQLRGSHVTFLQPTLKGIVLSALGLPVSLGELVVNGVISGIPIVVAQASAILASSAPLISDDGWRMIAHMDHGTGCDVIALLELYRWWVRRTEWAPFRGQNAGEEGSSGEDCAIFEQLQKHIRPHIFHEVRAKSRDLIKTLATFGLAPPAFLHLTRASRWEAAEDVCPLTPSALMMCIASITLAFPNRTAAGNDIHAKHASRGRRNLYTPAHRVHLVLRGVATASDEDRIKDHLKPASCSVRIVGENRVSVDVGVERVVDVFQNVPDYTAFLVRNVRNMTWDAYRLIKCTRAERRELNIAYTDSGDDVHLLSSWFVGSKAPIFIDRGSVVYPLTFDASVALPPTVVACHAVRRDNRVAYTSNLHLPGSLSVLPVVLAPILHWNGRAVDERQCLVLPSLPYCHPSPRRLKQKSVDLFRLVAALRETFTTCLDRVVSFYGSQEYLEATRSAGSTDAAVVDRFLLPAYQRLEKVVSRVEEDLGILLCVFMDELPKYYAPKHVAAFVASHAHQLPGDVSTRPFVAEACAVARRAPKPSLQETDSSSSPADDAGGVVTNTVVPLPSTSLNRNPQLLIDRTKTRQTLTISQLDQYHAHQRKQRVESSDESSSSYGGITHQSAAVAHEGNNCKVRWETQLVFPRRFARSIPADHTAAAVAKLMLLHVAPQLAVVTSTSGGGGSVQWGLMDLTAEASCGLFAFYAAMTACDMLVPLRRFVLKCEASWTKDIINNNIQLLTRHQYPNAGTMCQWRTTQNKGGLSPLLPPPTASSLHGGAGATTREGDAAAVVAVAGHHDVVRHMRLLYIPPVALQATACDHHEHVADDEASSSPSSSHLLTVVEQRYINDLLESLRREPPLPLLPHSTSATPAHVVLIVDAEREDVLVAELLRAVEGSKTARAQSVGRHFDDVLGVQLCLQHVMVCI